MDDNKQQENNSATSFGSLNEIIQFINYYVAVHQITPEDEKAFQETSIDIDLPKKGQQKDEALKKLERQSKDKAKFNEIRKFLHIGIEGKRGEPDSELFQTAKELVDFVNKVESDPSSVSSYEQNKFKTDLIRYKELLLGEREQVELTEANQNILKASVTETEKKVVEKPPSVSSIPVNEDRSMACAKGKWYDITSSQMEIIKKLNEKPGVWVPGPTMKLDPTKGERPDQIIKRLPPPIRKRIESKRSGYRLK